MDTARLIDQIVRQTTVLIAQLSTAAGIRAPLAHIADQVFLDLAREIEAQGVGRKVAADMFGMALRGYQRKVQRLQESVTVRGRTLWEAVLEHLRQHGSNTRAELLRRFASDGEEHVAAVLHDLRASGLVYSTGRGEATLYGLSSAEDQERLLAESGGEKLFMAVWYAIYRKAQTLAELETTVGASAREVEATAQTLVREGLVSAEPGAELTAGTRLSSRRFVVPVGSEQGWEVAVFDHFRALATAVASKLRRRGRSEPSDFVGGATLVFDLSKDHPYKAEVLSLLERVRGDVNALWRRVSEHNQKHPIAENELIQATFYFGQNVEETGDEVAP